MIQNSFLCLDDTCGSHLERVARTETVDGGACGDGERTEYYECNGCKKLYERYDLDTWEPFSFEKLQKDIRPSEGIPEDGKFCYRRPQSADSKN